MSALELGLAIVCVLGTAAAWWELRAARRDISMANALLRGRWDMYRPYFAETAVYPVNAFLDAPMTEGAETKPFAEAALANLVKAGIATPAS